MLRNSSVRVSSASSRWFGCVLVGALAACSGGGGSGDSVGGLVPGSDPPESKAQASRFLTQATFGPTRSEIDKLSIIGYAAWLDGQHDAAISLQRPTLQQLDAQGSVDQSDRVNRWWRVALDGQDQLRQRVAFALSEIFVVSDVSGALSGQPIMLGEYYDTLARGAFGSYRELLEAVTLSPAMGKYLSMVRNQKANPAENIRPDENYAREVMQLFTVGLVMLEPDGTPTLDNNSATIPTYTQTDVEELARVLTGWNFADAQWWSWTWPESFLPMEPWEQYHDTGAKTVLGGAYIPAGGTARVDLELALDALSNHPNVGPFFSKQLIQRLVTSNPSPAYVARVAAVFADDGTGERGDLYEVVKALLMDDEARHGHEDFPDTFGKVREPLLRQTALWRAFDAHSVDGRVRDSWPEGDYGQAPLRSPSVFNFFSPKYSPPGPVQQAGLVAPELQIANDTLITTATNRMYWLTLRGYAGNPWQKPEDTVLYLAHEKSLAHDADALLDHLQVLLLGTPMPSELRTEIRAHVETFDAQSERTERVVEALYLIVSSPEFCVQK